jgi:hypothetical protein
MFRMARQWSGEVPLAAANSGLALELEALNLAMLWAADSRQTTGGLRAALDSLAKLSPMPKPSEPIRAEAHIVRNTGQLPRSELDEMVLKMQTQDGRVRIWDRIWTDLVMTPWELARARRVIPMLFAAKMNEAEIEPWDRASLDRGSGNWVGFSYKNDSESVFIPGASLNELYESTPLARHALPSFEHFLTTWNRNEVGRRALVQILALRSWQIRHKGRLPEKLSELVPSELADLPSDPFNRNQRFGYVRSEGQPLLPLGEFEPIPAQPRASLLRSTDNSRLLYSIGPDLLDDHALMNDSSYRSGGDFIFPLPEVIPAPGPQ